MSALQVRFRGIVLFKMKHLRCCFSRKNRFFPKHRRYPLFNLELHRARCFFFGVQFLLFFFYFILSIDVDKIKPMKKPRPKKLFLHVNHPNIVYPLLEHYQQLLKKLQQPIPIIMSIHWLFQRIYLYHLHLVNDNNTSIHHHFFVLISDENDSRHLSSTSVRQRKLEKTDIDDADDFVQIPPISKELPYHKNKDTTKVVEELTTVQDQAGHPVIFRTSFSFCVC